MLFNSLEFVVFFAFVYGAYLLLKHRGQNRLLIAASCLFYAAWNWKFLALMFVSISTDYFCARQIDASENPKHRKLFLILSIAVNLLILGFFKYYNFFATSLEGLLKGVHLLPSGAHWALNVILPVGISFYTFEAISYTVDVYRRVAKPARCYSDYLLFVIYFPHLVAGPIMRAKSFLPQIALPRIINVNMFYEGVYLFFWGLFEKMFVADNLAKIVDPVFAKNSPYLGGEVMVALYAFAFQIFCDFDGYSNMARGLGKCMGFDITINFQLPYFARNPKEFWQRWHISLSSWLRDYVYIPLGGNRFGPARMYGALFLTMLLGGLWHGASWTFVFWGAYHGFLLIGYRLWEKYRGKNVNDTDLSPLRAWTERIVFFHLVVIGWLFFRSQTISQSVEMLQSLFFNFHWGSDGLDLFIKTVAIISPLLLIQFLQFKSRDLLVLRSQHWLVKIAVYAFLTYLFLGWAVLKPSEFIYFQF